MDISKVNQYRSYSTFVVSALYIQFGSAIPKVHYSH